MPGISLGCGLFGPRRPLAPPAWSPADLLGCQMALSPAGLYVFTDAARSTPVALDLDPVGGWTDLSAAAHHPSQSFSARRPAWYGSGLGGGARPRVRFDEVNDVLELGAWCPAGACTIAIEFARYKALTGSAGRVLHLRSGSTYGVVSLVNYSGYTEVGWRLGAALASGGTGIGFSPGLGTGRHTLEIYYDGSGAATVGAYAAWLDGVSATLALTGVYSDSAAYGGIGALTDGTVSPPLDLGRTAIWDQDHRLNRSLIKGWLDA